MKKFLSILATIILGSTLFVGAQTYHGGIANPTQGVGIWGFLTGTTTQQMVQVTSGGAVLVDCSNCSGGGGGGSFILDEGAWTFGTTALTVSGGVYQITATSNPLTTGQGGAVQMTSTRSFFVNPRDASAVQLFGAATALSDSLSNPTLGGVGAYGLLWNGTNWVREQADSSGNLKVVSSDTTSSGSFTATSQNFTFTPSSLGTVQIDVTGTGAGMILTVHGIGGGGGDNILDTIYSPVTNNGSIQYITANGTYFVNAAAYTSIKIVATALVSGTATIHLQNSAGIAFPQFGYTSLLTKDGFELGSFNYPMYTQFAVAQPVTPNPTADTVNTGVITDISQFVPLGMSSSALTTIQLAGTWVGSFAFSVSSDGTTYTAIPVFDVATNSYVSSITANGIYIAPTAGFTVAVLTSTGWTSGTANVTLDSTINSPGNLYATPVTATNPSVGTNGAAAPTSSTLIGGSDGTLLQPILIDATRGIVTAGEGTAGTPSGGVSTVQGATGMVPLAGNITEINSTSVALSGVVSGSLPIGGDTPAGQTNSGNPLQNGGVTLKTTLPAPATDGQRVQQLLDKYGRNFSEGPCPRELVLTGSLQIAADTSSHNLIAAQSSGIFADIYSLVITNDATSPTTLTISDGTASYPLRIAASGGLVDNPIRPIPETTAATAWTAQLGTASNVDIMYQACMEK